MIFQGTATGYGGEAAYSQGYSSFAKKTGLDIVSPVLKALKTGRKKYGNNKEKY